MSHSLSPLITDNAFGLAYRELLPRPAQPTALLVLLHGVGGNENNLAVLAAAADKNTLVVLPRGPLTLAAEQFAWFRVSFTANGPSINASEAEHSRRQLIHFVEQLQAATGIGARRTAIAGFSQGGILSASVGLSAPESVAGFGILAGRILPELEPAIASRERLASVRAFVGHGRHDSKLPVDWAQRAERWLESLGVLHEIRLYPTDHELSAPMQADFLRWLDALMSRES